MDEQFQALPISGQLARAAYPLVYLHDAGVSLDDWLRFVRRIGRSASGNAGLIAHECIVDFRAWKKHGLEVEDAAKRLMDYGYHAPTMSFPVPGTLMIEPTESETKAELDRFCDALIAIHGEMQAVATGAADKANNPLKHAPHTAKIVCGDTWDRPYPRTMAAFPDRFTRASKFWPTVGRVDNVHGDRNLVCSCVGMEAYAEK